MAKNLCRSFRRGRVIASVWESSLPFTLRVGALQKGHAFMCGASIKVSVCINLYLKHYRLAKQQLPQPHPQLERHQQTTFRQAQAGTLHTPARLHLIQGRKTDTPPMCHSCNAISNQQHILWDCPLYAQIRQNYTEEWLATQKTRDEQRGLVDFIEKAISGSLDGGTQTP